ncbi:MAG: prefoldin subunit alpha [Candidatus Bathyarchaeota archaeon]|nr:MAG: prefoldin subunit alpha [Candidatus Bathyarchaeota archaeon]
MSSDEETFRRLLTELRLLESTADALQNRINLVNAALTELAFAATTIEGLEQETKGTQLLVPIGGGSFINAQVATIEDLVVGMGAGVSVEKPREEAKRIIEKRIAELQKSMNTLQQQLSQVLEQMRVKRQQLESVSIELSSRRQKSGVRKAQIGT